MFVFTFKDSNNNKIELTAPTKTDALKMAKRVQMGGSAPKYESHRQETEEEWFARMNRARKERVKAQDEQAAKPRLVRRRKAFSRNDRCPCGSGKKVKHCRCPKG